MRLFKADLFASVIIFILSTFFVSDIFLNPARLASFDIPFHITNMAQFYLALTNGDFPVVWTDGIANYGVPMSIVAHQLTSYLGAVLIFVTQDPLNAFKIVSFLGIFLSSLFYYFFVRLYFKPEASFAATFLYTFTSYKIINFYIRGALPEIFAAAFLPLILIGMYFFVKKRKFMGLILVCISFFFLTLNHPMMLLIYSFIYVPYLVFVVLSESKIRALKINFNKLLGLSALSIAILIGVGMASYYLLPLNLELKYFYYGQVKNHMTPGNFLFSNDFFSNSWSYFSNREIFPRGHIIFPGIVEIISIAVGALLINYKWIKEKKRNIDLLEFSVFTSIILLLFMTPLAALLYERINLFSNIQFPWRMLSAFIFLPPIIYAYLFTKLNNNLFILFFIALVSFFQFPQLYGKNYSLISKDIYFFTPFNSHSVLMNPIWTGKSEEYPIKKKNKPKIIEGQGEITEQKIKNSSRNYVIEANSTIRMVDYTFYFPGWNVYVDKKLSPIEFQNPDYRGVITYQIPLGKHSVELKFENTKVRLVSKIISLFFIGLFIFIIVMRKKISEILDLKHEA